MLEVSDQQATWPTCAHVVLLAARDHDAAAAPGASKTSCAGSTRYNGPHKGGALQAFDIVAGPICGDSVTFQGNGATVSTQYLAMRRAREDAGECLASDDEYYLCTAIVTSVIDGTCHYGNKDHQYHCVATAYCAYDLL